MPYKILDLFAGAGGLSLGFQQTGKFIVVAAAENNPKASKTYKRNFPETRLYSDVRNIDYGVLAQEVGSIDVVIGGPPCQGFSNANRQHSTLINSNNQLVKEYVRAVAELLPEVFVMENVAMLKSEVHRFIVTNDDINNSVIMSLSLKNDNLELFPRDIRFDSILEYAKNNHNIEQYAWKPSYYKAINILYKQRTNFEKFKETFERHKKTLLSFVKEITEKNTAEENALEKLQSDLAALMIDFSKKDSNTTTEQIVALLEKPLFVQRLFGKIKELEDNNIKYELELDEKGSVVAKVRSYSVLEYITGTLGEKYEFTPMILNAADYGAPQKRERFVIVGVKKGLSFNEPPKLFTESNYRTIRQAIGDLESIKPSSETTTEPMKYSHGKISDLAKQLRNGSKQLFNHICTNTKKIAQERFDALKEGENFHDLDDSLKSTYSNAERTQNTIYLKLIYDEPSGTVVNVRKSMWVHPALSRAISVREAARLQTFPDTFVFEGTKDSQYQQVGNAVPPFLAKAIAQSIAETLDSKNK